MPMTPAQRLVAVPLLLLAVGSALPFVLSADGRKNLYVLQAEAFVQGRLDVPRVDGEVSIVGDRAYVAFPPAPAVLLVPFVALLGAERTNTPLLGLLLAALSAWLLRDVLVRLAVDRRLHPWLLAAFFLGTAYWMALRQAGGVWFFAHLVATLFLLLAVREALGQGRAWLAGLFVGVAFLSRQLAVASAILVAGILLERAPPPRLRAALRLLVPLGAPIAACAAFSMALNHLRFGSPFDSGYRFMPLYEVLRARGEAHGLFSLAYLPFNLIYLLVQGFHVDFTSPTRLSGMVPDPYGSSILAASPFILVGLWADRGRWVVRAAWATIAAALAVQLLYFCNGWVQVNAQRYALDWWPAAMILVALGLDGRARDGEQRLWLGAVAWAVGLNAFTGGLRFLNPVLDWWVARF